MTILFLIVFVVLILTELIKGLSANGTPPVLQRYSWQLDLAYFMWSNIKIFRVILLGIMVILLWNMSPAERSSVLIAGIILSIIWVFIFWFFNLFWVGKYKFHELKNPVFKSASENEVLLSQQVLGVNWKGELKAYPANMIFYHHQFSDTIGNHPIVVTYCGMCRSGRVYDGLVDGEALHLKLVGAVSYNAILKDTKTGTWWRQETGEAVKGKLKGRILDDVPMEQMSLKNWLLKHPDSQILQYDSKYQGKYDFLTSLMNYEASFPIWFRQETPPLVIGLEINGHSRAYDWKSLQKMRMAMDAIDDKHLLLVSSEDGSSPFAYRRDIGDDILEFKIDGDILKDTKTGSQWNIFGQCIEGPMEGTTLPTIQIYQQFIRAWVTFHPDTSYYNF